MWVGHAVAGQSLRVPLWEWRSQIDPNRVSPTRSLSSQDVAARNSVRLLDTAQLVCVSLAALSVKLIL